MKLSISHLTFFLLKARSVQLKAVVISERVLGFDHPNTIQQYVSTATHLYIRECTLSSHRKVTVALFLYVGPLRCVCVCWRGDHPGTEVFPQSSSVNAYSARRRPSIHRNTGCRFDRLESGMLRRKAFDNIMKSDMTI